jgi:hypothetical protein
MSYYDGRYVCDCCCGVKTRALYLWGSYSLWYCWPCLRGLGVRTIAGLKRRPA